MKEKLIISPEKPSKYFDQKSLDMARSRGRILSNLLDQLPIDYIESFGRVSSFIIFEDAKPFGKDWQYFKTAKDFQLYANLNAGWIGEPVEDLSVRFSDMSKGFYHYNQALNIFIDKETKGLSKEEMAKTKKNIRHLATQKIELIKKSNKGDSLPPAEIPQVRNQPESTPETHPANEDTINISLDLLRRVRKSIPESERKQFDSKVFDIISE